MGLQSESITTNREIVGIEKVCHSFNMLMIDNDRYLQAFFTSGQRCAPRSSMGGTGTVGGEGGGGKVKLFGNILQKT